MSRIAKDCNNPSRSPCGMSSSLRARGTSSTRAGSICLCLLCLRFLLPHRRRLLLLQLSAPPWQPEAGAKPCRSARRVPARKVKRTDLLLAESLCVALLPSLERRARLLVALGSLRQFLLSLRSSCVSVETPNERAFQEGSLPLPCRALAGLHASCSLCSAHRGAPLPRRVLMPDRAQR